MSQLRQDMINAMQLRNFSENTQKSYITVIKQFASYYKRSPANITEQEAQNYILYLVKEKNLSWSAILVLHTWGQNLSLHPHIHCIVPGGALTRDLRWVKAKSNYLFPVKAMAKLFRANYLRSLQECYTNHQLQFHGNSQQYSASTIPHEKNICIC